MMKATGRRTDAYPKKYPSFYGNDLKPPDRDYFVELMRVSKNQIIFGANHFISKIPFDSPCWIVWDKDNGDSDFADCELAWTSFGCAVRKFKWKWNGFMQEDMKNKQFRIHPTEKPIALYKCILQKFAQPDDIILDTHVGSASSLIACHETGHKYVGFEIDKTYYDLAKKRLDDAEAQMTMFDYEVEHDSD